MKSYTLITAKLQFLLVFALRHLLRRNNSAGAVCCVDRNRPIGNPNVDQRLHRLCISVREKAVEFGNCTKVDKARVEVSPTLPIVLPTQVPERVDPMGMIEMRVDAENLTKACAAVMKECFGKACTLANPIAAVDIDGPERVCTRRSSRSFSRERFGVVNLAIHPPLDQVNVLGRRHRDRIFLVVQPGIRVAVEGQN